MDGDGGGGGCRRGWIDLRCRRYRTTAQAHREILRGKEETERKGEG